MTTSWCLCGLGNPGANYASHRHNLGAQFIELLVKSHNQEMIFNKKLAGRYAKIIIGLSTIHAYIPESYMNLSGTPVRQMMKFLNLKPEQLIVAHDELDIAVGQLRLKKGGGSGGHNGIKDIDRHLGTPEYYRLRLGIGRPTPPQEVSTFVLKAPTAQESVLINKLFEEIISHEDWLWTGAWDKMKNYFHAPGEKA